MEILVMSAAAFLAGMTASMGLGGGMFLIVYLTMFAGMTQAAAQGISLVFFIPAAALSLMLHMKNRLLDIKKILPAIPTGIAAATAASYAANSLDAELLKKAFGAYILIFGMKQLYELTLRRRTAFSYGGTQDSSQE